MPKEPQNLIESVLKELNNLGYSQLFKDEKIFICPVCKNTEFICKKCIESFLSTALEKQQKADRAKFIEKIVNWNPKHWDEQSLAEMKLEVLSL
jgi:hypothetical protein